MMLKKPFLWLLLVGVMLLASACAENSARYQGPYSSSETTMARPSRAEIETRILQELEDLGETEMAAIERSYQLNRHGTVNSDIPIVLNERVEHFIEYYQTKMPARFTRYLNRSGRYYTMMRDILKEYGLPQDLFYLALIESGFTNTATSHAGACGPWQFMPATARRFGLRVDSWVDERRDPVKATHAAAQYLKFLYGEFNSWYLAAAAYNAGEGKIKRALTMYESNDFWSISQTDQSYLAEETKQYVPRMIAAAIIAKEPARFGFKDVKYEEPFSYDEMSIHPTSSLAAIAKAAGMPTSDLLDLNPELKRAASPPGSMYSLKIPKDSLARMTQAYASLTPEQRMAVAPPSSYRVVKGDTLGAIARRQGCTVAQICSLNPGLKSNSTLRVGQNINLPGSGNASTAVASNASNANPEVSAVTYRVRGGDTLGVIAQRNNCSVAQLYTLNPNLNNKPNIREGQSILVPGNVAQARIEIARSNQQSRERDARQASRSGGQTQQNATTYRVRSGDTLGVIAQRNNTTAAQLYALNPGLNNKPNIKVGQTLNLPGSGRVVASASTTAASSQNASSNRPGSSSTANKPTTYKVQSGDTLSAIAQRNNTTAAQLYALNPSLNNKPNIKVGQTLNISSTLVASNASSSANRPATTSSASKPSSYKVQAGDTLSAIAQRNNTTAAQLYALNPSLNNKPNIKVGQTLNLPGSSTLVANSAANSGQAGNALLSGGNTRTITHQVQRGDTIHSLARTYNLSAQEVTRQLGRQTLYAGEKLSLKVPSGHAEARSSSGSRAASQEAARYYVVQAGDTLWGVSSRFNVSVNDIKRLNNLNSDRLSVGTKLQLR